MSDKILREAAEEMLDVEKAQLYLRAHRFHDQEQDVEAWDDIHVRWQNAMNNVRAALADSADAPEGESRVCRNCKKPVVSWRDQCSCDSDDGADREQPSADAPEVEPVAWFCRKKGDSKGPKHVLSPDEFEEYGEPHGAQPLYASLPEERTPEERT